MTQMTISPFGKEMFGAYDTMFFNIGIHRYMAAVNRGFRNWEASFSDTPNIIASTYPTAN